MMFWNIPKDCHRYITQQELFQFYFGELSLEEVTFHGFVNIIRKKTIKIQRQELCCLFAFTVFATLPFVDNHGDQCLNSFHLLSLTISFAALIFWFALKFRRIDFDVSELKSSMKHPDKFDDFLIYVSILNKSNYPLLRNTAWRMLNSGQIHQADNGILALIGAPKDRAAIRSMNFCYGKFIYPHPDLLIPKMSEAREKFDVNATSFNVTVTNNHVASQKSPVTGMEGLDTPIRPLDKVYLLEHLIRYENLTSAINLLTEIRGFIFNDVRKKIDKKSRTRLCDIIVATIKNRNITDKSEREVAVFNLLHKDGLEIDKQSTIVKISRNYKYDVAENMLRDYLETKKFKDNTLPIHLRKILHEGLSE